jgi:hypothetical protein
MDDLSILPECYVDTNLAETLAPPKQGGYNHQKGCGTVALVMQTKFADRIAVGIIDKDKRELNYLRNEFDELCNTGSLFLYKHHTRHHYFIQISPAIERFILDCAKEAGLLMSTYDLPGDVDLLRKEAKKITSKKDLRFKRLFKDLSQRNVYQIECLKGWIQYLVEYNYKADLDVLRTLHKGTK